MSKVFVVITVLSRVVETIGPIPGAEPMNRCIVQRQQHIDGMQKFRDKIISYNGATVTIKDVEIYCAELDTRPELESIYPAP